MKKDGGFGHGKRQKTRGFSFRVAKKVSMIVPVMCLRDKRVGILRRNDERRPSHRKPLGARLGLTHARNFIY